MSRPGPQSPVTGPAGPSAVNYLLLGIAVGAVLGAAAGFFAYPTLYAAYAGKDAVATPVGAGAPRAGGHFTQADPADRMHYGSGTVTVADDRVELGADFAVAPGPKYHLYLVPEPGIDADARVDESLFVDLGPLKAFAGAQVYPIPAGVAVQDYGSVVVWSEQLNTLISPAEIKPLP